VTRVGLIALALLATACARPRPEPAAPPRINDSVPERAAGLRAADGKMKLDVEEERWGVEGAQERKRRAAEEAESSGSGSKVVIPMPPPNDSGAFAPDGGPR
jgi:hypothetical protein